MKAPKSPKSYADDGFVMVDLGLTDRSFPVVGLPVEAARKLANQIVEACCVVESRPLSGAGAVRETTGKAAP